MPGGYVDERALAGIPASVPEGGRGGRLGELDRSRHDDADLCFIKQNRTTQCVKLQHKDAFVMLYAETCGKIQSTLFFERV